MILRITFKLTAIFSLFICISQIVHAQDINQVFGTVSPGKSITIKYKVDVNISFNGTSVSNQGTVSGTNFTTLLTDDPDVGGASDPTTTPIVQPAVPVELISFLSAVHQNNVELSWSTATEINNYGFEVERAIKSKETEEKTFQKIGFVPGAGNSNSPKSYTFTDKKLSSGNYSYRLKQIDNDGAYEYLTEIEIELNAVPLGYSLLQNYPNPFNPSTKIEYNLSFDSRVKLKIYNIIGENVVTLVDEVKTAGFYDASWNAANIPSGIYLY